MYNFYAPLKTRPCLYSLELFGGHEHVAVCGAQTAYGLGVHTFNPVLASTSFITFFV